MSDGTSRREFVTKAVLGAAAAPLAEALGPPFGSPAASPPRRGRRLPRGLRLRGRDAPRRAAEGAVRHHARVLLRDPRRRHPEGLPDARRPAGARQDLGGWYSGEPNRRFWWSNGDTFNTFGQWLSGMARMSKATGDAEMRSKAIFLMGEWASTIEPDGWFFYSRRPWQPHYIYDKQVGGLVDMARLCRTQGRPDASLEDHGLGDREPGPQPQARLRHRVVHALGEPLPRVPGHRRREVPPLRGPLAVRRLLERVLGRGADGRQAPRPPRLQPRQHDVLVRDDLRGDGREAVPRRDRRRVRLAPEDAVLRDRRIRARGGPRPGGRRARPPPRDDRLLLRDDLRLRGADFKLAALPAGATPARRATATGSRSSSTTECLGALPMGPKGATFYYSDYRIGGGRKFYHPDGNWPCCSGTYPQVLADYHNVVYFRDAGGLLVNLFVPSRAAWNQAGTQVVGRAGDDVPGLRHDDADGAARQERGLRREVPGARLGAGRRGRGQRKAVSGRRAAPGRWAVLRRTWNAGRPRRPLRLPMRLALSPIDAQHPKRVAVDVRPGRPRPRRDAAAEAPGRSDGVDGRRGPGLEFAAPGQPEGAFLPFYKVGAGMPYDMYFDLAVRRTRDAASSRAPHAFRCGRGLDCAETQAPDHGPGPLGVPARRRSRALARRKDGGLRRHRVVDSRRARARRASGSWTSPAASRGA